MPFQHGDTLGLSNEKSIDQDSHKLYTLQILGGYGGDYYGGGYGGYGRNVSVTHCLFQFGLNPASQLPVR